VWLVQVGELGPESSDGTDGQYPSFDGFREAVTGSTVGVEQAEAGFEVSWSDTSEGDLSFSWSGPLEVDGDEVAISGYPRMANEYVSTDGPTWSVNAGGSSLILDTENWSREIG
jgi:hypothetical protein